MFLKSWEPSLFSAVSFDAISFLAFILGLSVYSVCGRTSSRVVSCELLCASVLGVAHATGPRTTRVQRNRRDGPAESSLLAQDADSRRGIGKRGADAVDARLLLNALKE